MAIDYEINVIFVLKPNADSTNTEIIHKHLFVSSVLHNTQNIFENFVYLPLVKTQVTTLHIDQNTD